MKYQVFKAWCCPIPFTFPIESADRHNTALVCHRWRYLACHPRMWLRVDASIKDLSEPGVYPNIEAALAAARFIRLQTLSVWFLYILGYVIWWLSFHDRPGDTILIAAGDYHQVSNIQINKPLCLVSCS